MPVLKFDKTPAETIAKGVERKMVHTGDLMTVIIDFSNGPWKEAEPPHSHPHVQTCYLAKGELIFYCEGEPDQHLFAGDMFFVHAGKKHSIKLLSTKARLVDSFSPIREDFLVQDQ